MIEIVIPISHRWENEEQLAKRIARIVCFDDQGCKSKDTGYKWVLDERTYNWWMSAIETSDPNVKIVKIACRYDTPERMEALRIVLHWLVG